MKLFTRFDLFASCFDFADGTRDVLVWYQFPPFIDARTSTALVTNAPWKMTFSALAVGGVILGITWALVLLILSRGSFPDQAGVGGRASASQSSLWIPSLYSICAVKTNCLGYSRLSVWPPTLGDHWAPPVTLPALQPGDRLRRSAVPNRMLTSLSYSLLWPWVLRGHIFCPVYCLWWEG